MFFNLSQKIYKYYQPRASVPQVVIMFFIKTNPLFLGVCQAPSGNRSPRLWWVIGGISIFHALFCNTLKYNKSFVFYYLFITL